MSVWLEMCHLDWTAIRFVINCVGELLHALNTLAYLFSKNVLVLLYGG